MYDRVLNVRNQEDFNEVLSRLERVGKVISTNPTVVVIDGENVILQIKDEIDVVGIGSVVNHFKEKKYLIYDRVVNSEDGETMFVYQALYPPFTKYVRYEREFNEIVDFEKYPNARQCYRFVPISFD